MAHNGLFMMTLQCCTYPSIATIMASSTRVGLSEAWNLVEKVLDAVCKFNDEPIYYVFTDHQLRKYPLAGERNGRRRLYICFPKGRDAHRYGICSRARDQCVTSSHSFFPNISPLQSRRVSMLQWVTIWGNAL